MSACAPAAPSPTEASPARPSGGLLVGLALLLALVSVYASRQADADLWGHLRYGRHFVEGGGSADPFAYTTAGHRWSSHEYLAQVLLWLAYAAAGAAGLIALKCLLGALAVYFLWGGARAGSDDPRVWVPVFLLTSHTLTRWFQFRPQLFTFLLFALFVREVFRHLTGKRARLWLLPALMPLWVNLHGGFLAGLGAVGLGGLLRALQAHQQSGLRPRALARATAPLALALAGCLAGTLLNPLGWRLWPYLATELGCEANRRFIAEWQPTTFAANPWTAGTLAAVLALLVVVWLFAELGRAPVAGLRPWLWLLSCLPLALMACRSVRHVPILAVWATPVLALLAQGAWEAWGRRETWQRAWLLAGGALALPALLTACFSLANPGLVIRTDGPVLGKCQPYGAVAYLRANGLHGRAYNPLWWGSYLTWELHPDVLVSMDGRNVTLYSPEQVADNLSFYLSDEPDLEAPWRAPPDFLLVPADAPVLGRLRQDRRWVVVYEDGEAVVLVPAGHEALPRLRAAGPARPAPPPPGAFR